MDIHGRGHAYRWQRRSSNDVGLHSMWFCFVAQVAMRYWRRVMCWLFLCSYPGLTFSATGDARVMLLLSEEGGAYREVAESFIVRAKQLAKKPPDIEVARVDAMHLDHWRGAGAPQLVVTVGTRAAQMFLEADTSVPTLRVLITRNAHESLQANVKDPRPKITIAAIFLEQPWDRQFDFLRILLPKAQRMGVILGPASQDEAAPLTNRATHQGLVPQLRILAVQDNPSRSVGSSQDRDPGAMFKDIAEQSDVVLAVPDPAVLTPNSAKWLLYTAYQRGIPVIGFSKSYVSAGALGAVFSTPEQIGRQAAEIAARALQEPSVDWAVATYPKYFSVAINRSVARSLRFEIPDDAEVLRKLNAPEVPP